MEDLEVGKLIEGEAEFVCRSRAKKNNIGGGDSGNDSGGDSGEDSGDIAEHNRSQWRW